MKNIGFCIGWIIGFLVALPILIIFNSITMGWFLFEIGCLLVFILIWFFSNYKIVKK